jgi:hypothetical protein
MTKNRILVSSRLMVKPSAFLQVAEKSHACAAQPNQAGQNFNAVVLQSNHHELRSANFMGANLTLLRP